MKDTTKYTLSEIASAVGAQVQGDGTVEVAGVASLEAAAADHVVFVEEPKLMGEAMKSGAGAIVASPAAATLVAAAGNHSKPLVVSDQPRLTFARIAAFLGEPAHTQLGVHPTAVVHSEARLGLGVSVGPHAVIEQGAEVGARCRIGAGAFLGAGVALGEDCVL